jgi:hypothetical protein
VEKYLIYIKTIWEGSQQSWWQDKNTGAWYNVYHHLSVEKH